MRGGGGLGSLAGHERPAGTLDFGHLVSRVHVRLGYDGFARRVGLRLLGGAVGLLGHLNALDAAVGHEQADQRVGRLGGEAERRVIQERLLNLAVRAGVSQACLEAGEVGQRVAMVCSEALAQSGPRRLGRLGRDSLRLGCDAFDLARARKLLGGRDLLV